MICIHTAITAREQRGDPAHDLVGGGAHRLFTAFSGREVNLQSFAGMDGDFRAAEMLQVLRHAAVLRPDQRYRQDRISAFGS